MTLLFLILFTAISYYFFIYKDKQNKVLKSIKKCNNCGNAVEKNFNVCPICKETLRKKCPHCNEMVEVSWNFCPFCEEKIEKGKKYEENK